MPGTLPAYPSDANDPQETCAGDRLLMCKQAIEPICRRPLNPKYTAVAQQAQELAEAARTVCRPIVFLDASTDAELDAAFATLARQRVVAVLVGDPFFDTRRDQIIALAAQQKLPALRSGGCSAFVKTGLSNPCASGGVLRHWRSTRGKFSPSSARNRTSR